MHFKASKLRVLHKNGNHGRADDSQYATHYLASLSPKQHSTIRVMCIPTSVQRESRSPRQRVQIIIFVNVVATNYAFQAVLVRLCCHVLGCLPDIHTRTDAFVVYNIITLGYTYREPHLLDTHSVIKPILFCLYHL